MFSIKSLATIVSAAAFTLVTSHAYAVPTQVVHIDTPLCDPLFIPTAVHELGDFNIFPTDESMHASTLTQTAISACPLSDDPTVPNIVIDIRNLSGIDWQEVWYVADPETTISNFDGEANEAGFPPLQEAFRIDYDISDPGGSNHALLFESMTPDGIWEDGESWQFILQDYVNLSGLAASDISSIGVGNNSPSLGIKDSSGSIIAIAVPEPASIGLLGLGAATLIRRVRRM